MNRTTLFLGDISLFCTEKEIYDIFRPFGDIIEIKIMRSEKSMRNLSYGFIKMKTMEDARNAMNSLNGILFCGRRLRVSWAEYRNRKEPKLQHYERMESSSVHFSYISYQLNSLITEESLRRLFSSFGEVMDTSIKKSYIDQSINRQCGYGFVHYPNSESGMKAALNAATALKEVTIEGICFKCSISHNLEKHLLDGYLQNLTSSSSENSEASKMITQSAFGADPQLAVLEHVHYTELEANKESYCFVHPQLQANSGNGLSKIPTVDADYFTTSIYPDRKDTRRVKSLMNEWKEW